MTILNTIVAADRVGLLADSSVIGGAGPTVTAKTLALPGLGLLVGCAGSLTVLQAAVRMLLNGLPPGSTAGDVAATAGPALADVWNRTQRAPTSIVLGGIVGEEAQAYILSAPEFPAVRMPPGVWLLPPTRPAAERSSVSDLIEPPAPGAPPEAPAVLRQPAKWALGWTESLEVALAAVATQREQRRVTSGGGLELLVLDVFTGITSRRLAELELVEAASP